jgi:hypothetical protein
MSITRCHRVIDIMGSPMPMTQQPAWEQVARSSRLGADVLGRDVVDAARRYHGA